tara:strand:- start:17 stop:349 length:333 start_codon:yes stop_codon:yes gene_type:complete
MNLDHEAIRKAYPNAITIDDDAGAFDSNGSKITLEQSAIDSARTTLDIEAAAIKYQEDRSGKTFGVFDTIYPSIGDQLDNLYKDILAGKLDSTGEFAKAIKTTKDKYPKP